MDPLLGRTGHRANGTKADALDSFKVQLSRARILDWFCTTPRKRRRSLWNWLSSVSQYYNLHVIWVLCLENIWYSLTMDTYSWHTQFYCQCITHLKIRRVDALTNPSSIQLVLFLFLFNFPPYHLYWSFK